MNEHDGKCVYCNDADGTTFDHVIPLCHGGQHEISNLVPACPPCNFAKHDKTPEEWAMIKGKV